MKHFLPVLLLIATVVLVLMGFLWPAQAAPTVSNVDVLQGSPLLAPSAPQSPAQAVEALLVNVQRKNWERAYSYVANTADVELSDFILDLVGTHGSLRTYAGLEGFQARPLHQTNEEGTVRTFIRWSTALGPIYDLKDLKTVRQNGMWKVVWPLQKPVKVPPQVIPVNYLRWDVINRGPEDDWGAANVDSPRVRIVSMSSRQYLDDVIIMGEIVNEDTVPAFVDVSAVLLDPSGKELAQETSFDKISHTLLPNQVSPYRIDFPGMKLQAVKKVRIDARALLVPASADPVVGVLEQRLDNDPRGGKVVRGQLLNESGQIVNIAQVLAAFYDDTGKVIWVADGYVDRALLPQVPEGFSLAIPDDVAAKVQNFRVTVNHYGSNPS